MGIESKYIWMDGEMLPYEQANVHILSHTLHYGLGAFEGIRAYKQKDGSGGIFKVWMNILSGSLTFRQNVQDENAL